MPTDHRYPRLAELFDLSGRTIIVTGASSGIGAHFADLLHEVGANVVAVARRVGQLEANFSHLDRVMSVQADVTSTADQERLLDATIERFGQIDVLVNNAGGAGEPTDDPFERFDRGLALNLTSPFRLSSLAVDRMGARGGAIVNVASILGVVAAQRSEEDGYCAAKAGLIHLTRQLGSRWASRGVRVNAIAPGFFLTGQTVDLMKDDRAASFVERSCPMHRMGELSELGGALIYLASDASSYMTGQTLIVDGGWTTR